MRKALIRLREAGVPVLLDAGPITTWSMQERRYVEGRGRLEEEFVGEWGSLVRGVLQIDPGRRWKAGECLKRFFEFN